MQTPDPKLVVQYLVAIAECFKVNWECPQQVDEDSFGLKLNLPTAPIVEKQQQEPISVLPIVPQENANEMADFEDLNRRFEALKKRS